MQSIGDEVTIASTNQDKSKLLAKGFFPSKPTATARQNETQEYPNPICRMHKISRDQIKRQLRHLRPYKVPEPNNIPHVVLSQCTDILTDIFLHIYSAILEHGHYYVPWRYFTTVVLQKPGKPRYNIPKAYQPIALLNMMERLFTEIIAEQLTYYTENTSSSHRPGRTTTDVLHMLTY